MAMIRALNADPPIDGIAMSALENLVAQASAHNGAHVPPAGASDEGSQGQGHSHGMVAAPTLTLDPDGLDDTTPADYGVLRPLLDEAKVGDPTEEGIPRRNMFREAARAGAMHTVPYEKAISVADFPKSWQDRPLASWLLATVRRF